jgi:hypothetical protein
MADTVISLFGTRADADSAIDDLREAGFEPKDISFVMKDEGERRVDHPTSPVATGAVSGATTGAVIGGLAGLLIGIGAIAIPGIGALLIGGPLAAAIGATGVAATTISGAATGVVAGGIIGALVNLGVPEEEARGYEERVKSGAILVAVHTAAGDAKRAVDILEDNNAEKVRSLHV